MLEASVLTNNKYVTPWIPNMMTIQILYSLSILVLEIGFTTRAWGEEMGVAGLKTVGKSVSSSYHG